MINFFFVIYFMHVLLDVMVDGILKLKIFGYFQLFVGLSCLFSRRTLLFKF